MSVGTMRCLWPVARNKRRVSETGIGIYVSLKINETFLWHDMQCCKHACRVYLL